MSAPPVQGGTQRLSLLSHPRSLASGLPSGGPTAPKGAHSQKSDGIHETQTGTETISAHASCPAQEERLLAVLCLKHSLLYSVLWVHSECCQVPFRNEGAGCKSDQSMAWGRHRKASWKREREWGARAWDLGRAGEDRARRISETQKSSPDHPWWGDDRGTPSHMTSWSRGDGQPATRGLIES